MGLIDVNWFRRFPLLRRSRSSSARVPHLRLGKMWQVRELERKMLTEKDTKKDNQRG